MKNKEGFRYFWKRRSLGKSFMALGFSLPVALLFGLCLISFFRPFYEHQNQDIPSNSLALSYKRTYFTPLTYPEIKEKEASFHPSEWQRLEGKTEKQENVFLLSYEEGYGRECALIAPTGFELSRLGSCQNFPVQKIEDEKTIHVYGDSEWDLERIPNSPFYQEIPADYHVETHLYPDIVPGTTLQFMPRNRASVLFLFPEEVAPKEVHFYSGDLYATFSLSRPLSDQDVNYFASVSSFSPGILPSSAQWMIHPALDYVRFYPVYHAVTSICFTLAISTSVALLLSQIGKEFLKTRKEKGEIFALKTLGMKKSVYVIGSSCLKSAPFYLGFLAWYILYFIFMAIFEAAAGFTFFFPWWGHLLYWAFPLLLNAYLAFKAHWEFSAARPER